MARIILVLLVLGSFFISPGVLAGDFWNEKPYTQWTKEQVLNLLTRSPWALPQQGYSVGLGPVVVWASSLTVRQAQARLRVLSNTEANQPQSAVQPAPAEYYVIVVIRPDSVALDQQRLVALPLDRKVNEEFIQESAYLELKREKKKIVPSRVVFNRQGTMVFGVEFHFAKEYDGKPTIGPEETKVEFGYKNPLVDIRTQFDLRKMVRDGKPDL